ncbi:hypothetical protein [Alloprevotella sp. oral taxon 473]|uniref:hypothetical protein n=1 Tax=Alloprevotella sp. oral taxon 473 TaxID=712469 RepID=UPI0002A262F4|nr:hypothetical protein [Alloprevotella sp. oral taxon 473]EKX94504.1 hypothetical protein HMPREF9999_00007 [Alloprevotella sp. oral taxon 473 str. F0040]
MNTSTDEFYTAREGYLAGYEIRPVYNIKTEQQGISFRVDAGMEFNIPIPLYIKDEATAAKICIPLWTQYGGCPHEPHRVYRGRLFDDCFQILDTLYGDSNSEYAKRVFIRCN